MLRWMAERMGVSAMQRFLDICETDIRNFLQQVSLPCHTIVMSTS